MLAHYRDRREGALMRQAPLIPGRDIMNATKWIAAAAALVATNVSAAPALPSTSATTTYHLAGVDGVGVFYQEAGPRDAPTIVLLHGFPSSSRMYETLIPLLATRYHLIAPDYPGFGQRATRCRRPNMPIPSIIWRKRSARFSSRSRSTATACTCRTMARPSGIASCSPIPNGCRRW